MIRFLADENFRGQIVSGLLQRDPALELVCVQDVGLRAASDQAILEWAAQQNRVLLTHDLRTMPALAYARVGRGERMPGIFVVGRDITIQVAIEDVLILAACSEEGEWEGQVRYLPYIRTAP